MPDYVQYHVVPVRGPVHPSGHEFQIDTSERKKNEAKRAKHNRVWLIRGEGKPRKYFLHY
jgi:hypothetical protein